MAWCVCTAQVVTRYTEATGVDWDDRCSTCSSSSSGSSSEFDYYLDRRLRPAAAPAAPGPRFRHVGENFVYASAGPGAFVSPSHCVRSPSAGRVVPGAAAWPARDERRNRRRARKQTGKRCLVS